MDLNKPIKRFVIVGGGSAGWIAAACLGRMLLRNPKGSYEVKLVASKEIGIIGVGEATIPSMHDLISFLNIDENDFIRETDATFKLGIMFKDWHTIGQQYFHPFGDMGPIIENQPLFQQIIRFSLAQNEVVNIDDISICTKLAIENKFAKPSKNGALTHLNFAYHFDAAKVVEYLEGLAKHIGVQHIEGKITDISLDQNGSIDALQLDDGRSVEGDFFIDCSGFAALLIEKKLGSDYEDWSKWLLCDRAIALPTKSTAPILPYTISAAKDAGWTWRIPLQSRIGNGYVYSSNFVSDEAAEATLRQNLDSEVLGDARQIKFIPGRRKEPWVKNCLSIGLASGFLEPLESTAIHLVISNVFRFFDHFPADYDFENSRKAYNARSVREIEEIRDFLILHYCTTARTDSEMWRYVSNMDIPDSLDSKLQIFRNRGKTPSDYYDIFRPGSWIAVLAGMGVKPMRCDPLAELLDEDIAKRILGDFKNSIQAATNLSLSHDSFLSKIIYR